MKMLIRCRNVECQLGRQPVLTGVDFDVAEGESVALLGSSGSGKSTLLRVIAGLEIPESGDILIDGQPATAQGRLLIPAHRRGVAMLFQDLALWPNLTVENNVRLALSSQRLSRQQTRQRIDNALKQCTIAEFADRKPGTLSGGQQQRAALARALAMQPKVLLLDEPFGGLDLLTKQSIIEQIAQLQRHLGLAIVLVTHDGFEATELCDSMAVLETGRIMDRCTFQEPRNKMQSELGRLFQSDCSRDPSANCGMKRTGTFFGGNRQP